MKTEALCKTCGNFSNQYADLGLEGYECELCYNGEICAEPLPDSIEIYLAHFGGHAVASCKLCNYKSVYWECACELAHDCEGVK